MLEELKQQVYEDNMELHRRSHVTQSLIHISEPESLLRI